MVFATVVATSYIVLLSEFAREGKTGSEVVIRQDEEAPT